MPGAHHRPCLPFMCLLLRSVLWFFGQALLGHTILVTPTHRLGCLKCKSVPNAQSATSCHLKDLNQTNDTALPGKCLDIKIPWSVSRCSTRFTCKVSEHAFMMTRAFGLLAMGRCPDFSFISGGSNLVAMEDCLPILME